MNTELIYSDATKLAELIRKREISPVEVVRAHLDRIEAVNPKSERHRDPCRPGSSRRQSLQKTAVLNGEPLGPLHGVPFTAKDSIDTARRVDTTRLAHLQGVACPALMQPA